MLLTGGTSLSSKDMILLATLAYYYAREQAAQFPLPKSELGILVDLSTEASNGAINLTFFETDSMSPEELCTFNHLSLIDMQLAQDAPLVKVVIRVVFEVFQEPKQFAFRTKFDSDIFDGTICSCCPFPAHHKSFCIQHKNT